MYYRVFLFTSWQSAKSHSTPRNSSIEQVENVSAEHLSNDRTFVLFYINRPYQNRRLIGCVEERCGFEQRGLSSVV